MTNKLPEIGTYKAKVDGRLCELVYRDCEQCVMKDNKGLFVRPLSGFWDVLEEIPEYNLQEKWILCNTKEEFQAVKKQLSERDSKRLFAVDDALKVLKYHLGIKEYFNHKLALDDIKEAAQNLVNVLEAQETNEDMDISDAIDKITCEEKRARYESYGEEKPKSTQKTQPDWKLGIPYPVPIYFQNDLEEAFKQIKEKERLEEKEKPKSIWKDVSELPKQHDNVYADIPCIILDGQNYYRFGLFSGKDFYEHHGRKLKKGYICSPKKYCTLTDFINDHEDLKQRVARLEKLKE